jgi:hypothetical protein
VTAIFGPDVGYNLAAMLAPALSAFTAYLLCRHVTRSFWPSLAGGYLFGFSAYVVSEELGHLHMTAVFLLPLVSLVLGRYLEGELGTRALAWRLGLLLGAQLWISTEVFFTLTLALVVALVLAFALVRVLRPLRTVWQPVAGGYLLGVLWAAPLVAYSLAGFHSGTLNDPSRVDADLANFVVPTHILALTDAHLTRISSSFPGGDSEHTAYLGIPTLVIVVLFAIGRRRSPGARFLVVSLLLAMVAALGTSLTVEGDAKFRLPWHWLAKLPLFDNALPARLAVYAALAAAVIVALWLRDAPRLAAVPLVVLAIAVLVPAVWRPDFRALPQRWPFFTQGVYKLCIPRNENLAIFPYGFRGDSMLWQAESGFWFRMAGGYLLPKPPKPFIDDPLVQDLTYTYDNPGPGKILAFAKRKDVARIVSVTIDQHPNGTAMHRFGPLQVLDGVMVAPACGYPPLTPQPKP